MTLCYWTKTNERLGLFICAFLETRLLIDDWYHLTPMILLVCPVSRRSVCLTVLKFVGGLLVWLSLSKTNNWLMQAPRRTNQTLLCSVYFFASVPARVYEVQVEVDEKVLVHPRDHPHTNRYEVNDIDQHNTHSCYAAHWLVFTEKRLLLLIWETKRRPTEASKTSLTNNDSTGSYGQYKIKSPLLWFPYFCTRFFFTSWPKLLSWF